MNETSPAGESNKENLLTTTVIMLSMMVIAIVITTILKIKNVHYLSETSLYLLFGLIVGLIFVKATSILNFSDVNERDIQLKSSFFYMVLLPPIIFEGGFTLQRLAFVRNLAIILALALLGAMYSTILTSILMYSFTRVLYPQMSLIDTLVFGSIISSTDPVSVLGMLPPTTDRNLYMIIFGESALNDAVALILYRFFSTLAAKESGIDSTLFFKSLFASILLFASSIVCGFVVALLFSLLTKHVKSPEAPIFEQLMFLVFAYMSYLVADLLGLTGIISIFTCGVAMAHYSFVNMSKVTLLSSKVFLRAFSSMCDAFVFIYLGLGLVAFGSQQTTYNVFMIIAAVVSILISRTHVFVISFFYNLIWKKRRPDKLIPKSHQVFLWFCGLRGAVSFALAVETLENHGIKPEIRAVIFGTTLCVVTITVLLMGGLTPFMMKFLKLTPEDGGRSKSEALPMEPISETPTPKQLPKNRMKRSQSQNTIDEYMPKDADDAAEFVETINIGFWRRLYEWDQRWVKPFFTIAPKIKKMTSYPLGGVSKSGGTRAAESDFFSDAEDNDEDELDRVTIALAADMIGIKGTTVNSSTGALITDTSNSSQQGLNRSRAASIFGKKSLLKIGHEGSRGTLESSSGAAAIRGSPNVVKKLDNFLDDETESQGSENAIEDNVEDDANLIRK